MSDDFPSRLQEGLALERPEDSIESVTNTVVRELEAFDPTMKLRRTGYFNHSFIPDLVASWPKDTSASERFVYLKYDVDVDYLLDDVELVRDTSPIVFRLNEPRPERPMAAELDAMSVGGDTLLTDPSGLEEFIAKRSSSFVQLVSSALAQGGRGLLDHDEADQASTFLVEGFEGARELQLEETRRATDVVTRILAGKYAGRVGKLLQAIWVGSGGSLLDFPGPTDLSPDLSDDALQFLLTYEGINDASFWERLASRTGIRQIGRLDLPAGTPNLDQLIKAGRSHLYARSCRVRRGDRDLFAGPETGLRWKTDRGLLTLAGDGYAAYLGEAAEDTAKVKSEAESGVTLEELREMRDELKIHEAELAGDKGHVSYTAEGDADVRSGEVLEGLATTVGPRPIVKRVMAARGSGTPLTCDFTNSTVSSRTSSRPSLADIVNVAVLALTNPSDGHVSALDALLSEPESLREQLF